MYNILGKLLQETSHCPWHCELQSIAFLCESGMR